LVFFCSINKKSAQGYFIKWLITSQITTSDIKSRSSRIKYGIRRIDTIYGDEDGLVAIYCINVQFRKTIFPLNPC